MSGGTLLRHEVILEPQIFEKEVTVFVWSNYGGAMKTEHFGHSSLLVRMKKAQDMHRVFECRGAANGNKGEINVGIRDFRYFSFWPDEGISTGDAFRTLCGYFEESYLGDMIDEISRSAQRNLRKDVFAPRPNQKIVSVNRAKNKKYFGIKATKRIHLPVMSPGFPPKLGLNTYLMGIDANRFYNSDHFCYILASKSRNCSGVAARFLKAGGAEAYYSIPEIAHVPNNPLYMSPNDVEAMATATSNGLFRLNLILDAFWKLVQLRAHTLMQNAKFQGDNTMEIYRYDTWILRSAVKYKTRGLVLRAIDRQIRSYHKYTWDEGYQSKLMALCSLISYVYKHIQISSSGKRDDAIHMLVYQIVNVVLVNVMQYKTTETWPYPFYLVSKDDKGSKR